tara:strand:- start:1205 stop:1567 length:363 start_codon:yes stop_codon:yes gene_type:complete
MPVRHRKKVFGFKLFRNGDKKSDDSPDYGNANVQCYDSILKQVAPILLSPDKHYEASGWVEKNGDIGLAINEITMVESADSIADNVSQAGFKPIAEAVEVKHYPEGRQEAPQQVKVKKRW